MIMPKKTTSTLFSVLLIFFMLTLGKSVFAYNTAVIDINVSSLASNGDNNYIINIAKETANAPAALPEMLSLQGGEEALFSIRVSEPGTYVYKITSAKGTDPKTKYDDSEYTLVLYAEEEEAGRLSCIAVLQSDKDSAKTDELIFANKLEGEESEEKPEKPGSETEEESGSEEQTGDNTETESESETETETETQRDSGSEGGGWFSGDNAPITLIVIAALVSLAVIIGMIIAKKKNDKDDE